MGTRRSAKELFSLALERPAGEREAFLDAACTGDPGLRARLARLLDAHREGSEFLAMPTGGAPPAWAGGADSAGVRPGATIGPYTLLEPLGEGGFGAVFMAQQHAPVARRVALKIIKAGMDTRQVIARFDAERQALALMDHPCIARVFDAGATETGRPYFVMELVRGEPITDYCDGGGLGVRERLELFQQVCHAVQHAHQKGIIHRDLKPSNVLVADVDGRPTPKIIDFGIAKAIAGRPLVEATVTDARQFLGTPEYMSPEQAGLDGVDVDTRSDIYALGALLYELLVGSPPFDSKRLREAGWDEMRRVIREEEPARPSARLHAEGAEPDRDRRAGAVRGDLDWIVMKCLEKDRSRRYETANSLAVDVARHLSGEAVLAAPPSRVYRVRKFLRRRRVPVATGVAGLLLLVCVAVLSTSLWLRASASAERAREAEARARDQLWHSLLLQARARRRTQDMGRRFDSLEIIRRTAAIGANLEVRNEAIAALALLDVRPAPTAVQLPAPVAIGFPPIGDRVFVGDPLSRAELRSVTDARVLAAVPYRFVTQSWAHSVSFSRDGGRAAFLSPGGDGKIVAVWDFPQSRIVLETPSDGDFALCPQGRLLAVVRSQTMRLIDIESSEIRWERSVPPNACVQFRPDHGQLSVVEFCGRSLELRDVGTGEPSQLVDLPSGAVGVGWNQAGDRLAVSCQDFRIIVNRTGDFTSWISLRGHQAPTPEVYFDPGGEFVMSACWDSTSALWDITSEQRVLVLPEDCIWPARSESALLRREVTLPLGIRIHRLELQRPASFRRVAPTALPREAVESPLIARHPTLPLVVTGHVGGCTLTWWSPLMEQVLGSCNVDNVRTIAFDKTGRFLYSVDERGLTRHTLAPENGVLRMSEPEVIDAGVRGFAAVAASGRFAVALHQERAREASWIDLAGAAPNRRVELPVRAFGLAISPDERYVAISTWNEQDAAVWDLRDDSFNLLGLDRPAVLEFSDDGRFLIASMRGGDRVYEAGSWRLLSTLETRDAVQRPTFMSISADARVYAKVLDTRRIRLFDLDSHEEMGTLESPEAYGVHRVMFTTDAGHLIGATKCSNVFYVWDLRTLRSELRDLGLDWSDAPIPARGEESGERPRIRSVIQEH